MTTSKSTYKSRTLTPCDGGYRQGYVLVLCMAGFRTLTPFFGSRSDCLAETAPDYMAVQSTVNMRSRQLSAVERSLTTCRSPAPRH